MSDETRKQHTVTSIVTETVKKMNIGRKGGVLILLPKLPDEDIVLLSKDAEEAGITVAMYKRPEMGDTWKIKDTFTPIMISDKKVLVDGPTSIEIKDETAYLTYADNTKITVGVEREISDHVLEEATNAIKAIPEQTETVLDVTPLIRNPQTTSISTSGKTVVVGNDFVVVKYDTENENEAVIKNSDLVNNIKSVAKNVKGSVGISSEGNNAIVSTNTGDSCEEVDEAGVYLILGNYQEDGTRTATEILESTNTLANRKDKKAVISSESGIVGLFNAMKAVMNKYSGTTDHIVLTISKDKIRCGISDGTTEITNEVEIEDGQTADGLKYPYDMIIKLQVGRYISDLHDCVNSISTVDSGQGQIIIINTEKETAIFGV